MAKGKLFIGRKVRELRLASDATQRLFAEQLGISTSYLNQIESNQRPVSAAVLVTLVDKFKLDFSDLASGETDRLLSALTEALSDPLFDGYLPTVQELKLVTQNAPGFAHALIKCHQTYRRNSEQLVSMDQDLGRVPTEITPYEEVRDFFHFVDNYVHELDGEAERLAYELGIGRSDNYVALSRHLEEKYRIRVVSTFDTAAIRLFDAKSGTLQINAYAAPPTRLFQLAIQVAQLHANALIGEIVSRSPLQTDEAREICRIGLQNYFAGALLMPYRQFQSVARELRHDLELLSIRFGTSLEQTCHRLSTLQRPGLKGVPIFFARIDRAGNITKRHSATKLQFARFGAACPLWNAHQAFEASGRIQRQLAETPDGVRYLCLSIEVNKGIGGFKNTQTSFALALGCEISYSGNFVYADDLAVSERASFQPIGISCRICERANCASRAVPPYRGQLRVNHSLRLSTPYELG